MPTWFRMQNPFVKKCSYPTFSTGITVSAGLSGSNLCIIFSARWSKALQMTSARVQGGSALQTQTMLRDVTRIKWPSEIPFRDIQYLTAWDVWSSQRLNIIKTWACSSSTAQSQIFEKCTGNLQPSTAYNLSHRWCSQPWTERFSKKEIQSEKGFHLLRRVCSMMRYDMAQQPNMTKPHQTRGEPWTALFALE
jgi:hypothetical protein